MIFAQLPLSDSLIKQLIDMGTVGIILLLVMLGAVLFLFMNRRERAGDREANQNTSALINVVGELSKAINSLKDDRDLDTHTRGRLADSLNGVSQALANQQKTNGDFQKLIDDSLSLMRESVDGLNKDANKRINLIHEDVKQVLQSIEDLPSQYTELKQHLTDILKAVERKESATNVTSE